MIITPFRLGGGRYGHPITAVIFPQIITITVAACPPKQYDSAQLRCINHLSARTATGRVIGQNLLPIYAIILPGVIKNVVAGLAIAPTTENDGFPSTWIIHGSMAATR